MIQGKKLDKSIISSWRVGRSIFTLCVIIALFIAAFFPVDTVMGNRVKIGVIVVFSLILLYSILNVTVFPIIQYKRWSYFIDDEKIVINEGLLFISTIVIPIIRVQTIELERGPIDKKFSLATLNISLASGSHSIPGILEDEANELVENLRLKLKHRTEVKGILE